MFDHVTIRVADLAASRALLRHRARAARHRPERRGSDGFPSGTTSRSRRPSDDERGHARAARRLRRGLARGRRRVLARRRRRRATRPTASRGRGRSTARTTTAASCSTPTATAIEAVHHGSLRRGGHDRPPLDPRGRRRGLGALLRGRRAARRLRARRRATEDRVQFKGARAARSPCCATSADAHATSTSPSRRRRRARSPPSTRAALRRGLSRQRRARGAAGVPPGLRRRLRARPRRQQRRGRRPPPLSGLPSIAMFEEHAVGGPISAVSRWTPRTLEAYIKAGGRPRWMERIGEIEALTANARTPAAPRAARARGRVRGRRRAARPPLARARRGVGLRGGQPLIGQHNDWFPIERDLAMDPRTKDYVKIRGKSYRREPLGAAWILREFPALTQASASSSSSSSSSPNSDGSRGEPLITSSARPLWPSGSSRPLVVPK